jgi:hypothetical protein
MASIRQVAFVFSIIYNSLNLSATYRNTVVVDLDGPPLFAQNLPSNVSKTQNLRLKIREFFAILGVGPPPLLGAGPLFRNFWIRHCTIWISIQFISLKPCHMVHEVHKDNSLMVRGSNNILKIRDMQTYMYAYVYKYT